MLSEKVSRKRLAIAGLLAVEVASPFGSRIKRVEPPASAPEQPPHIFEYDGRGNQFHRTGPKIPGGEQSISYNIFNLPDTIVTGSGASAFTVAFDYNASGQRVRTIRPDSETRHFGSIYEREERPTDPDIAEEHRYYIFAMGQRVAEVSRARPPLSGAFVESTRYFHYDHRGSVIALSNSTGDITDELDYGTFGEPLQAMPTEFGYTSHRHEEGLGLVDAQGRFYDPIFGIFVSADPISPLGGSSPRLNRYAYVGYDPVNFTDPTGFFFKELWNGITWGLDFAWGNFVVAPTNLLLTGRAWNTTWDTDTTEGLFTALAATAAGLACGAASGGNPIAAGACAGAVAGGLGTAFAGGTSAAELAIGITSGGLLGAFGGAAGHFANVAVFNLSGSHVASSIAAAWASSGTSVGFQMLSGGDVNWAQVAANGVVSGLLAWERGAAQDAALAAHNAEVGEAAGQSARVSAFESTPGARLAGFLAIDGDKSSLTCAVVQCASAAPGAAVGPAQHFALSQGLMGTAAYPVEQGDTYVIRANGDTIVRPALGSNSSVIAFDSNRDPGDTLIFRHTHPAIHSPNPSGGDLQVLIFNSPGYMVTFQAGADTVNVLWLNGNGVARQANIPFLPGETP